ncbi:hypothetical protein G6F16_011315 [Rhizopus arrhizus]|nr:hypothetical protein G6F24_011750 [Rhizopus arrhizus]KAG0781653.1 hypothetical protein G6F21_011533 [Rhizopus arrhizus]KAG0781691.1 hypothetical protein G6F22_009453 [Rhizopus arrhizus]KAG0811201.1 hypothetical protein G6F20_007340 [Rhizopus arrhizus]KAG0822549.1 hypothetical protein G6F19_011309 [Rhizopus arrhizus]
MYPTVCKAAQRTQPEPLPPSLVDTLPPAVPSSNNSQANLIQQLCATVEKLTSELSQARLEIQHLQARINNIPTPTTPANATEFPTPQESRNQPIAYPDAPWHNTASREAAAARIFHPPSLNQGFKYLYLPTKAPIPVGTLRTTLRKVGVNNARLLDIHYPARNTLAILIHNDYEKEFTELIHHHNITIKADFNPSSGEILADPKYSTMTQDERDTIATELQTTRIERALQHIRAPVKFAVARFFYEQQWISKSKLNSIVDNHNPQLSSIFEQTETTAEQDPTIPETHDDTAMDMFDASSTQFSHATSAATSPSSQL